MESDEFHPKAAGYLRRRIVCEDLVMHLLFVEVDSNGLDFLKTLKLSVLLDSRWTF